MDINVTMLGQAITFAILVLFTMKFVWPPLNNMLEERSNRIAEGLSAAEKGRQELLDAKSRVSEELKLVQSRATEIMANAEKRADLIISDASVKAGIAAERIINDAKAQIEQEVTRAREQLRGQVSTLVVKGAEQILRSEIKEEQHAKILATIMAEL